jgi:plasmid replication initiation protein
MAFKQLDLFVASAVDISPKAQQELMQRCWFSLSTNLRTTPIKHEYVDADGEESWVEIKGTPEAGIATIWDQDVIIFIIAQYMHALNQGMPTSPRFSFTGYDYLQFVGKQKLGGKDYADLWARLLRLQTTNILTNIRQGDDRDKRTFSWLSEAKQTTDNDTGKHRGFEVVLPEWLYESVIQKQMVLTLDDKYFKIRGGLERWLYLFARKSSGHQTGGWTESVQSLHKKSGSTATLAEFRRQLKKIVTRDQLLGYETSFETKGKYDADAVWFGSTRPMTQLANEGRMTKGPKKWRRKISESPWRD